MFWVQSTLSPLSIWPWMSVSCLPIGANAVMKLYISISCHLSSLPLTPLTFIFTHSYTPFIPLTCPHSILYPSHLSPHSLTLLSSIPTTTISQANVHCISSKRVSTWPKKRPFECRKSGRLSQATRPGERLQS